SPCQREGSMGRIGEQWQKIGISEVLPWMTGNTASVKAATHHKRGRCIRPFDALARQHASAFGHKI
ncbi:hypothetical protein P153DRAFT_277673, partial [Dothidotthia symphoricarpi CBS 119687]